MPNFSKSFFVMDTLKSIGFDPVISIVASPAAAFVKEEMLFVVNFGAVALSFSV